MCHTSDTFHVCYEVTSVNTAELKSMMRDGDQQNMEKLVDCQLVVEQSVREVAEQSRVENRRKTKEKLRYHHILGPVNLAVQEHFSHRKIF